MGLDIGRDFIVRAHEVGVGRKEVEAEFTHHLRRLLSSQASCVLSVLVLPKILAYRLHLHLSHLSFLRQLRSWGPPPCHLYFIFGSEKLLPGIDC